MIYHSTGKEHGERHVSLLAAAAGYGLLVLATVMGFEFLSSKKVLINYAGDPGLAAHTGAGFPYWFCHRRMRGQEASGTQTFCLFPVKTEIESGNVPFDPFCGDSDATFPFFTLRIYPADTWKVICLR